MNIGQQWPVANGPYEGVAHLSSSKSGTSDTSVVSLAPSLSLNPRAATTLSTMKYRSATFLPGTGVRNAGRSGPPQKS